MTIPAWVQPGLTGAVVGAIILALVGFNWGGWTTKSTTEKIATQRANTAVIEVLTPLCVTRAQEHPDVLAEFAKLTSASQRQRFVTDAGWVTFSEGASPNRDLARSCASALEKA